MSGFDLGQINVVDIDVEPGMRADEPQDEKLAVLEAQSKFRQFLRTFTADGQTFPYRAQLSANYEQHQYFCVVNMTDLTNFDAQLAHQVIARPTEYLPLFETAAVEVLARSMVPKPADSSLHPVQIQLTNYPVFTEIRKLGASMVSKLVCLRGIVVSASRVRVKATSLSIMCRNCRSVKEVPCGAGFGSAVLPRICDSQPIPDSGMPKCPLDPYRILGDSSKYIDHQRLKLQENPESVPTGQGSWRWCNGV